MTHEKKNFSYIFILSLITNLNAFYHIKIKNSSTINALVIIRGNKKLDQQFQKYLYLIKSNEQLNEFYLNIEYIQIKHKETNHKYYSSLDIELLEKTPSIYQIF
jgi:hypothetical protein